MSDEPQDFGLFTPRSERDAVAGRTRRDPGPRDLFTPGADGLEDRLRLALRAEPVVTADLQQVIQEGRARGTRIRRRRRALAAVGTAVAVSVVVGGVAVLLPRTPPSGPVAAGTPTGSASASRSPSGAASGAASSPARPVPSPAAVGGPDPVVPRQPGSPSSIAVSGDGRLLAISAVGVVSQDGDRVRLFDLADPAAPVLLGEVRVAGGNAVSVALSPDGGVLAVAWSGGAVRLYDLADPASPRLFQTLPVTTARVATVEFGPTGRLLATGGYDDTVRLWQVGARRARPVLTLRPGLGDVVALAFRADGARLAVGSSRGTTVWPLDGSRSAPLAGGRPVEVPSAEGTIDLGFAGDRLLVADGDTRVWDVEGSASTPPVGRLVARLAGTGVSLAVAPGGDRFAVQRFFIRPDSFADAEVTFWSLGADGQPRRLQVVHTPLGMEGQDRGLAWLPDGSAVYATTSNGGADLLASP